MWLVFKMAGAVLVMGAAGYFAMSLNQRMEFRKQQLRKLYSILLQLKSEIQYMSNPLPESLAKLAKGTRAPFCEWLCEMVQMLECKADITFADVWKDGIDNLYSNSSLEIGDVEPLRDLADKLGTGDISSQLKAIDYALLHLEANRTTFEAELVQRKKVTYTLSLFCGAMTLILLL